MPAWHEAWEGTEKRLRSQRTRCIPKTTGPITPTESRLVRCHQLGIQGESRSGRADKTRPDKTRVCESVLCDRVPPKSEQAHRVPRSAEPSLACLKLKAKSPTAAACFSIAKKVPAHLLLPGLAWQITLPFPLSRIPTSSATPGSLWSRRHPRPLATRSL